MAQVEGAVLQARSSGASRRAPMNLAQAEDAYAQALLERRRQDMRFAFRRDYREVERVLAVALHRAESAATLTRRGLGRDRAQASRLVADAESRALAVAAAADAVWIAEPLRKRLQRSRALASQARALLDGGAYEDAATQARAATQEAAQVSAALFDVTSRFTDPEHLQVWRTWVADAVAWSKRTGKTALVVDKDAHVLLVYQGGRVVREYTAELGWNNVGDKRRQGDGATPEGRYKITELKGRGRSRYHKALLMDYPNAEDLKHLAQLKAAGVVPANTRAGGLIEIHGEGGRG